MKARNSSGGRKAISSRALFSFDELKKKLLFILDAFGQHGEKTIANRDDVVSEALLTFGCEKV